MAARALELFGELRSETRPQHLVKQMSGGQRQAVAIARTRLSNAKLVMMDEPTAAISVRPVEQGLSLIPRLKERGLGVWIIYDRMPISVWDLDIDHHRRHRPLGRLDDVLLRNDHVDSDDGAIDAGQSGRVAVRAPCSRRQGRGRQRAGPDPGDLGSGGARNRADRRARERLL